MKRGTGNKICYVPACSNPSFKVTQVANKTTLEQLFYISSENIPPVPASNEEKGYPLCKEHYGALYQQVNQKHFTKKCKTCDNLLCDLTKTRKCPDPALVQSFLVQNTDFREEIIATDRVCYACYKSHLVISKHMHSTTSSTDDGAL